MPDRYTPLAAFLAALSPETTTVTLTLADIEEILGAPLPKGAAARGWWYNGRHRRPSPVWTAVGWRVTQAVMRSAAPTITFTRAASGPIAAPFAGGRPSRPSRRPERPPDA